MSSLNYIDLFAGAGGLSESFTRSGYRPIAHVESDPSACRTLQTRAVYHWLKAKGNIDKYYGYLSGEISWNDLIEDTPPDVLESVIQMAIGRQTVDRIFTQIDHLTRGRKVNLVVGGPPCQAYSLVGRSRDPNRMKNDPRNYLFNYYAKFLERYKPEAFVFENVTGLFSAGPYFEMMIRLFESRRIGYRVAWKVLDASQLGVLQKRKRVIIVGRRGKGSFAFPDIPALENGWQVHRDLFADLPAIQPGERNRFVKYSGKSSEYLERFGIRNGVDYVTQHIARNHNDRDLEIYRIVISQWLSSAKRIKYNELPERLKTHQNQRSFLDRFKVVDPHSHSHTLVAHIAKDGHHYIYPDLKQVRSLSVREAARIQSFPDDYHFEGGQTAAFRQIGNAVPPLMGDAIAKMVELVL